MNQQKSKLFRYMFHDKSAFRRFKRAYTRAPKALQLETIAKAKQIKATGPVHNVEVPNAD